MTLLSAVLAVLLAAPASAGEGRRVEIPAVPPTIAAPLSPSLGAGLPTAVVAAGLPQAPASPLAGARAPDAASASGPAAAAAPAAEDALKPLPAAVGLPQAAAAAPAEPSASARASRSASASGSGEASGSDASGAAEADQAQARALFDRAARAPGERLDLDAVVKNTASRKLRAGVFIQQEQEGSLLASDPRDSSGNVFRYYRPAILREDVASQVHDGLSGFEKAGAALRRAFRVHDRKSEYAAWDAWPLRAKLEYLDKLEKAVVAEQGAAAAWKGKVSLLLERKPDAPDFLTKNPHMEAPPPAHKDAVGAKFLQPEVVSDTDRPASTINEAIGRTKRLIADTGHAGTQYHVFVKAAPEVLRAQLPQLEAALQLLNDALFARAAQESFQNVTHPSLLPWHRGRSDRVAALLRAGAAGAHVPQADDADSEKHAFIGLRYWGQEDGKLVISFELRGASLPFKVKKQAARDMGTPEIPKRDYTEATRWLTLLSLYAEQLAQGRAPALPRRDVTLDLAGAERLLSARAAELGMPAGSYFGVGDLSRRLTGRDDVAPGLLFPFAASAPGSPELRAYMDAVLHESARMRAAADSGQEGPNRGAQYMVWSAYSEWASRFEARQRGMVDALWRAVGS